MLGGSLPRASALTLASIEPVDDRRELFPVIVAPWLKNHFPLDPFRVEGFIVFHQSMLEGFGRCRTLALENVIASVYEDFELITLHLLAAYTATTPTAAPNTSPSALPSHRLTSGLSCHGGGSSSASIRISRTVVSTL